MSVAEDLGLPQTLPQVRFATRRIGHANLYVNQLDRSFEFYNKICGFEGIGFEPSIRAGFLSNGNSHHDFGLVQADGTPRIGKDGKKQNVDNYRGRAGLNHIGWETLNKKKLSEAYKRAIDGGIEIKQSLFHGGSFAIYLYDPDGNLHEFYADATKDWRPIFHGGDLGLITSQWNPLADQASEEEFWLDKPEFRHEAGAPVRALRAGRTVFFVSDVDKLMPFYRDVAGFDLCYMAPDKSYAYLRGSAKQSAYDIALIEDDGGNTLGYHHIACQVPDEKALDEAEAKLAGHGVKIVEKVNDARKRSIFIADPDTMLIEFYVERTPDYAALGKVERRLRPFYA